jgi:hypothetical protein
LTFTSIAADPAEAAVVEKAQQLGLQVRRHLADFVEKHRALVRQFHQPRFAAALRAGEGAGGIAEQFAFGEVLRQCRAVQGQERSVVSRTDGVAGAGHHSLPVPVSPWISSGASRPPPVARGP